MKNYCKFCGIYANLTKHHLIPQHVSRHKNKYLKHTETNIIEICRSCHDQVHALWSENELRDNYNTPEKLLAAPEFAKFIAWKKKHPEFVGHAKMSNKRKHR